MINILDKAAVRELFFELLRVCVPGHCFLLSCGLD